MKKFLFLIVLGFLWCNVTFAECIWGNCINGYGTFTWPEGARYVGEWENNRKHGQGTITWPDGVKYVGEWENNRKHGQGTFTSPDGYKYVGEWENDKTNGQGTITWPDGVKEVGEYKDDKRNGIITFIYPDGIKKVQEWENDLIVKNFSDSEITEYEKKQEEEEKIKAEAKRKQEKEERIREADAKRKQEEEERIREADAKRKQIEHFRSNFEEEEKIKAEAKRIASGGLPKCTLVLNETNNLKFSPDKCFLVEQTKFNEQVSYEGEIKNSKKHGKGKLILIRPELTKTYEGNFENDFIINGSLKTNHLHFEGEFKDFRPFGNGQLRFLESGDIYVGKFKDGLPHGKGKWIYGDGDEYVGVFNKGEFSDPGRNERSARIKEELKKKEKFRKAEKEIIEANLSPYCRGIKNMCMWMRYNGLGQLPPEQCYECGF